MRPSLAEAILRTLLYADVFEYPLTIAELRRFLWRTRATTEEIREALSRDPVLTQRVILDPPYIAIVGSEASFERRRERERISAQMMHRARRCAKWLAALPFVRMVALTGSLAVRNSRDSNEDIDYLIVTESGRLWLARLGAVLLVHLGRLRRVRICPNFLLSCKALELPERSLFAAHELAQMYPFYGWDIYEKMLTLNEWAQSYLPNGFDPPRLDGNETLPWLLRLLKRLGERLLAGSLGDALERWEMKRKIARLEARAACVGTGAARFDRDCCKGHMSDYGARIREAYAQRLQEAGLAPEDSAGR